MGRESLKRLALHIWAPDLSYVGGLQRHLNFIRRAAEELLSEPQVRIIQKSGESGILFAFKALWFSLIGRPTLTIVGHVHFSLVAYAIKHLVNIPFWVVSYGIESWGGRKDSLKKPACAASRILSMSDFTKEQLVKKLGVLAEKVSVLPGSFDAELFKIKPKPEYLLKKYGLNEKQPVILTVCRMDKDEQYKGYDRIIELMPQLIQIFPDIRYFLVGYGNDMERVKALVQKLKLQEYIILPGKVTGVELCDFYNLCDCFAMPSRAEGFGIVFLEALACGKPVLAGNRDGSKEALLDGKLGALVYPDNASEILQGLICILKREHPNKNIYDPQFLRREVIGHFGFEKFKATVKKYLTEQGICAE